MATAQLHIENEFRAILTADSVRAATAADAVCGVQPQLVLEPADEQQVAAVLRLANNAGLVVIPRGGGTKLSWGNPPTRADVILSLSRLNEVIEHSWADLTVSVEAGCSIQKLQDALAKHGQRLALDALWTEQATIGGILSTNDSGSLRLRFGSLRDLIIGVTLALPDGTLASSGGKVVKNVAGYDLPKLITGAFGTLAVITRAFFRLHPLPRNSRTLTISGRTLDEMQRILLAVQDSKLAHTSLQTRVAHDSEPRLDILFEGTEAGIAAQEVQLREIGKAPIVAINTSDVWKSSQELWNASMHAGASAVVAQITTLPASIASTAEKVQRVATAHKTAWNLTMQATGIAWLQLAAPADNLRTSLLEIRSEIERDGGSLTALHQPSGMQRVDTWGTPGDALPLMRAVKNQFDPKNTLNPSRFLGGI